MKITIEFDTGNAAFEANYSGEVGHVIRQASGGISLGDCQPGDRLPLRDSNGNTIGEVRFSA